MKLRLLLFSLVFTCILAVPVGAQTSRYARVISENANLRDAPSISGANQQEIAEGTVVKVLDEKLPWYVVRFGNRVGWMHGNTLEFMAVENSVSKPRRQTDLPTQQLTTPPIVTRDTSPEAPSSRSGGYSRRTDRMYITGPRGGCYYLSGSGRKVYVDRSLCN